MSVHSWIISSGRTAGTRLRYIVHAIGSCMPLELHMHRHALGCRQSTLLCLQRPTPWSLNTYHNFWTRWKLIHAKYDLRNLYDAGVIRLVYSCLEVWNETALTNVRIESLNITVSKQSVLPPSSQTWTKYVPLQILVSTQRNTNSCVFKWATKVGHHPYKTH
jgi:hypothetical protein